MTLAEVLASGDSYTLICRSCGNHQPAYIRQMIEKHWPECEFEIALRRWDCIFCREKGRFVAEKRK